MKHPDNQHVSQRSGCSAWENGTLGGRLTLGSGQVSGIVQTTNTNNGGEYLISKTSISYRLIIRHLYFD